MNQKIKLVACVVIAFVTGVIQLIIDKNAYEITVAITATQPTYVEFDPNSKFVFIDDKTTYIKGDNSKYARAGEVCDPHEYCNPYILSAESLEKIIGFENHVRDRKVYGMKEHLIRETNLIICIIIYLLLASFSLKPYLVIFMPKIAKKAKEVGILTNEVVQRISKSEHKLNNELKLAQEEFARLKNFFEEGLISEMDFETGKASVQQKIHTIMSKLEMLKSKTDGVSEV